MTGRGVRFIFGLIVGVVLGAIVKGMRGSENSSEGASTT